MIMPYLSFTGSCREAFELYARAFDGEIEFLQTYGESPDDPNTTPENAGLVRHATVRLTGVGRMMGADAAWPVQPGSNVAILVLLTDLELAKRAFAQLAQGGQVMAELAVFEDAGILGALVDRFGFSWQFSVEQPQ